MNRERECGDSGGVVLTYGGAGIRGTQDICRKNSDTILEQRYYMK